MKTVLIGCEESGVMTAAFRAAGHCASSCDLLPTRGNPDWHQRGDVFDCISVMARAAGGKLDLIILHPDCTKMAVSGNRWHAGTLGRMRSIVWTVDLWEHAKEHAHSVALENPVSVIFQYLDAPVCYTQPWQHGHGETKKTGWALYNLPPLQPSNIVEGREERIWRMPPGPNRARDRSTTLPGVAAACAAQWG
jgi:hypothetical protein